MSLRRISILLGLLCIATTLVAAPRYSTSHTLTHHVGVALAGFEANLMKGQTTTDISIGVRGGGQLAVTYELQKSGFFFQIGVGADYTITSCSLNRYDNDTFPSMYNGEPIIYQYVYSGWREQQNQLRVIVPIRFGYLIGKWMYVGIGASYRSKPLVINNISVATRMHSEIKNEQAQGGIYPEDDEKGREFEDKHGFWIESDYTGKGRVLSATHEIAAEAEIGVRFALTKKIQMRTALYAGYDIPLIPFKVDNRLETLGDYSRLDEAPRSSTKANLIENLGFHSILDTNILQRDPHRLRAGLRITLLFNLSSEPERCMCY